MTIQVRGEGPASTDEGRIRMCRKMTTHLIDFFFIFENRTRSHSVGAVCSDGSGGVAES